MRVLLYTFSLILNKIPLLLGSIFSSVYTLSTPCKIDPNAVQCLPQDVIIDTVSIAPIPTGKKIFFASDFHLGPATSRQEKKILQWLDRIQPEAHALFLLGDIFDFWFEYKHAVPKGFIDLQSKLAEFVKNHIPVFFFKGNHEIRIQDYLPHALGIQVYPGHASFTVSGKKFLVGHGDVLSATRWQSLILRCYRSSVLQWLFSKLHPDVGIPFGYYLASRNRKKHNKHNKKNNIQEQDRIFQFCKTKIEPLIHHDVYVFGHLHHPYQAPIHATSTYYNLGDWLNQGTYGVFDGVHFALLPFA